MKEFTLHIMDSSYTNYFSGVDRYIELLIKGLSNHKYIKINWIHFVSDKSKMLYRREDIESCHKITIPLPIFSDMLFSHEYWYNKYIRFIYDEIKDLFDNDYNIIHLQTLNLFNLAEYIRNYHVCKIITHVHCIPWKQLYGINKRKFNSLYYDYYYGNPLEIQSNKYLTNFSESSAYKNSDYLICVTNCAKSFLCNLFDVDERNVSVIPNGIEFAEEPPITNDRKNPFRILYIGGYVEGKGIKFLLDAIRDVTRKGYDIELLAIGSGMLENKQYLMTHYANLPIKILGRIDFEELKKYYKDSHVGIIPSLFEQSSYAAIEMAAYNLPVICTAVDGLDEMFVDRKDALKIDVRFSRVLGLNIDVKMLSETIIELIKKPLLRKKLSSNAKLVIKRNHTLQKMVNHTISIYIQTLK